MHDIEDIINYTKKMTLLYVEDNKEVKDTTILLLESFFDNIIVATDGKEGLIKFKKHNPDLIITDINMPNMDGLEMGEEIRKIDKKIPIIVTSAHNETDYFLKSIKIKVTDYIFKPIVLEQLINVLYKIVETHKLKLEARKNLHLLNAYKNAINNSAFVSKTDKTGKITYVNDAFEKISGYSKEELLGKAHNIVRHPDMPKEAFKDLWETIQNKKIWKGIVKNKTKHGGSYYVDSVVMPILDENNNITEFISIRHDVTDIMNQTKQLQNNIKSLKNPILVYMKLDGYNTMEEFYDEEILEELQEKASFLLYEKFSEFFKFDKIYSLTKGEYSILFDADKIDYKRGPFVKKLKIIQDDIKEAKIQLDDSDVLYDIAIIISLVDEDHDHIFQSAKLGIKELIKTKKGFFIANNLANIKQQKAKENLKTISMIKNALNDNRIISYFQPLIDNKTQKVVKHESLVRLIDENGKILSPFFFLDVAKKSNYYDRITYTVLEQSFEHLVHCEGDVSINLSALDIENKHTRKKIFTLLEKYKNLTHRVVFELLEDEEVKNFETIKFFINKVKKYGVKIAIDDFGSGYSNYERLFDYQPDILKIDGSLVKNINNNSYALAILRSIVLFTKEQNIETVAEFVENEEIFNIIKDLGVTYSQGYYFGKPEVCKSH